MLVSTIFNNHTAFLLLSFFGFSTFLCTFYVMLFDHSRCKWILFGDYILHYLNIKQPQYPTLLCYCIITWSSVFLWTVFDTLNVTDVIAANENVVISHSSTLWQQSINTVAPSPCLMNSSQMLIPGNACQVVSVFLYKSTQLYINVTALSVL